MKDLLFFFVFLTIAMLFSLAFEYFRRNIQRESKNRLDALMEIARELIRNKKTRRIVKKRWNSYTNSYAYALNLNVRDIEKKIWVPGNIAKILGYNVKNMDIIERFKADLDAMRIFYAEDFSNKLERLEPGEWRIAIYRNKFPQNGEEEYVFIRQDQVTLTWSQKTSWNSKVIFWDENIKLLPKNTEKAELIGVYVLSQRKPPRKRILKPFNLNGKKSRKKEEKFKEKKNILLIKKRFKRKFGKK